jgi:hypothetical protein
MKGLLRNTLSRVQRRLCWSFTEGHFPNLEDISTDIPDCCVTNAPPGPAFLAPVNRHRDRIGNFHSVQCNVDGYAMPCKVDGRFPATGGDDKRELDLGWTTHQSRNSQHAFRDYNEGFPPL